MNLPLRLLIPARFRRKRSKPSRPQPGPPPMSIDFTIEEPIDIDSTDQIPPEQLEWLLAQARVAR